MSARGAEGWARHVGRDRGQLRLRGRARAMTRAAATGGLVAALLAASPIMAQDTKPYDDDLNSLAEIVGAIHYLRALCGRDDGQAWRENMQSIIRSEGTTTLRRVRLTQSFNKGYRSYQRTYRSCTESAETAADRFITQASEITTKLLADYE